MELEVIFDREDRLYRFGEVISGKVVVRPESDRTYSKIWIAYRWQTHGWGNRDKGIEEELIVVEENISLKTGECMELPFFFEAPNGPVTYHGHLLNVDWYLTAHAQSDPRIRSKPGEYDFLLQGGDPTDMVILGIDRVFLEDLPDRSIEAPPIIERKPKEKVGSLRHRKKWPRIINWITYLWVIVMFLAIIDAPRLFYLLPFCIFLIVALTFVIRRLAYRRILELGNVWVWPTNVWRDGEVYCHLDFVAKRAFLLRNITASISAQEQATKTVGTIIETKFHEVKKKINTQLFNEDMSKGKRISFDCTLPVDPYAPATFSGSNNALEWIITMEAEIKGWPNWQMTFPITVLP